MLKARGLIKEWCTVLFFSLVFFQSKLHIQIIVNSYINLICTEIHATMYPQNI